MPLVFVHIPKRVWGFEWGLFPFLCYFSSKRSKATHQIGRFKLNVTAACTSYAGKLSAYNAANKSPGPYGNPYLKFDKIKFLRQTTCAAFSTNAK